MKNDQAVILKMGVFLEMGNPQVTIHTIGFNTQMIQFWMICGSWGRALAALPIVPSPCARYNAAIAACEKGSCWEAALTFMSRRRLDGNVMVTNDDQW